MFSCEYRKIFKKTYFEKQLRTAAFYLSCLSTIIFLIHTELLPHVQLLLVRDIICVISVDKKCQEVWRYVKYCTIQITCTENIGNRVKQCENLKKKLEGVITSCFSTFNIVTKSHVLSVRLTDLVGFSRFLPS